MPNETPANAQYGLKSLLRPGWWTVSGEWLRAHHPQIPIVKLDHSTIDFSTDLCVRVLRNKHDGDWIMFLHDSCFAVHPSYSEYPKNGTR